MTDRIVLSPESFRTLYLRSENGTILTTESGKRIIVDRIVDNEWKAFRIYDYELQRNENKRNIILVDRKHISRIESELQEKIK